MKGPSIKPPSRKGVAPAIDSTAGMTNTTRPQAGDLVPLNFKVSPELKQDIKLFAATHNMSMVDVIKEGFALLKAQKSG